MSRVGVIVLAAGRSSRFGAAGAPGAPGAHKLLARIDGEPLVRRSVRAALDAGVGEVVVVTGCEVEAVDAALSGLRVRVVHEPSFSDGMATSLRRGLEALRHVADAVVVGLGDQPAVRPEAYRRIVATWEDSGAAIVVPRYAGGAGPSHPALFASDIYPELLALRGDTGARRVISRDPTRVAVVDLDWPPPGDVDTPDDLAAVASQLRERSDAGVGDAHVHPAAPSIDARTQA